MPLSSLSTVNTAMNNIYDLGKTAPMPLDAIEARRASNQAERLAQYEAETKRMNADELGRTGQATRAAEANTALILSQAPKITVKDPRSPEFQQQYKQVIQYLMNSGDQGAMKMAMDGAQRLEQLRKSAATDVGTEGGASAAANQAKDIAAAGEAQVRTKLMEGLTKNNLPAPAAEAIERGLAIAANTDPNTFANNIGLQKWRAILPNMSVAEKAEFALSFAYILEQVRKEHAIQNNYGPIDEQKAEQEALRRMDAQGAGSTGPAGTGGRRKIDLTK